MKSNPLLSLLTLLLLLAMGSASGATFPKGSPSFNTDFAKAQKTAKASGKPMVVVFSAPWCAACQVNKKKVYPNRSVKPYHSKFVWVYLNTDVKKNDTLANKYGVKTLPNIQFLHASGKAIASPSGVLTGKDFAKKLGQVLQKAK